MDDFPPICKQDPLEVRVMFIKEYFEMIGQIIKISDIPDEMYGGGLPIAKKRKSLKRKMTETKYLDDTPEIAAKVAKTSASQTHPTASDMLIPQQATQSVPNKTDSVNQQTPHTSPEETPSPNYFIPLQIILPEPVAETVVPESVQVTESESPVTVTVSEPIQQ